MVRGTPIQHQEHESASDLESWKDRQKEELRQLRYQIHEEASELSKFLVLDAAEETTIDEDLADFHKTRRSIEEAWVFLEQDHIRCLSTCLRILKSEYTYMPLKAEAYMVLADLDGVNYGTSGHSWLTALTHYCRTIEYWFNERCEAIPVIRGGKKVMQWEHLGALLRNWVDLKQTEPPIVLYLRVRGCQNLQPQGQTKRKRVRFEVPDHASEALSEAATSDAG